MISAVVGAFLGWHAVGLVETNLGHRAASAVVLVGCGLVLYFWARRQEG